MREVIAEHIRIQLSPHKSENEYLTPKKKRAWWINFFVWGVTTVKDCSNMGLPMSQLGFVHVAICLRLNRQSFCSSHPAVHEELVAKGQTCSESLVFPARKPPKKKTDPAPYSSSVLLVSVDRLWQTVMNIWLKKNKLPPVLTFR